jgi:hypothetical protein
VHLLDSSGRVPIVSSNVIVIAFSTGARRFRVIATLLSKSEDGSTLTFSLRLTTAAKYSLHVSLFNVDGPSIPGDVTLFDVRPSFISGTMSNFAVILFMC